MIIFELACGQGHRFEGWFGSSEDFVRQSESRMVRCPVCDDASVARIPSAKVRKGAVSAVTPAAGDAAPADAAPAQQAIAGLPAELMAKLREIVRSAENVGPRFPEEARKIHYGEVEAHGIYGETTPDEAEALADEGIEVQSLPWVPPADG